MSQLEQETIINFNRAEKEANIWSCDPTWITRIKKMDGARQSGAGWEVDVPKTWIKIAPPKKMNYTPEQLARKREMMKKLRASQQK